MPHIQIMGATLKPRSEIKHSVVLTQEQQDYICERIVEGIPITQICRELNIPLHHPYDYAFKDPLFDKRMEKARVYQSHVKVDELLNITRGCNTMADVARAKVDSDNIKWSAGKFAPRQFGENLNVNVSHHLDLSSILLAAENRVLPLLQAKNALLSGKPASTIAPGSTIDIEVIPEAVAIAPVATSINDLNVSPTIASGPAESAESDAAVAIVAIPEEWI
jgi:hypothetical protein